MTDTQTIVEPLLDQVHGELLAGRDAIARSMEHLVYGLEAIRRAAPAGDWQQIRQAVTSHTVIHLLHQEPFTRRCFYKPRGYAGDARMLDYLYGEVEDDDSTALGRRILEWVATRPAPQAVKNRREAIAAAIDATAQRVFKPRVLAVASGHLREVRSSHAIQDKQVGELVAFDQDARSLAVVGRDFGAYGVSCVQGRVRDLVVGRHRLLESGGFDLIYSAGLYDYLKDEVAGRLTQTLFGLLNPGGILLIGNFLPGIPDRGYMETVMDWHLIYRSLDEVETLAAGVAPGQIGGCRSFTDSTGNIGFVELTRAERAMAEPEF